MFVCEFTVCGIGVVRYMECELDVLQCRCAPYKVTSYQRAQSVCTACCRYLSNEESQKVKKMSTLLLAM